MHVTVITIVTGALETISKGLVLVRELEELELGVRVETIQIIALLRSTNILSSVFLGKLAVSQIPGKDYRLTLM